MLSMQSLIVVVACIFVTVHADYSWKLVKVNEAIPENAVQGGVILHENSSWPGLTVYIARKKFDNEYRIGKFHRPNGDGKWDAYFLVNDAEKHISKEPVELLVAHKPDALRWVPTSSGVMPRGAISFTSDRGQTRYICRGIMVGNTQKALVTVPEEAMVGRGWCQTWWYTRGIHIEYQVLVRPSCPDSC